MNLFFIFQRTPSRLSFTEKVAKFQQIGNIDLDEPPLQQSDPIEPRKPVEPVQPVLSVKPSSSRSSIITSTPAVGVLFVSEKVKSSSFANVLKNYENILRTKFFLIHDQIIFPRSLSGSNVIPSTSSQSH